MGHEQEQYGPGVPGAEEADIPEEFRIEGILPEGGRQIVDIRHGWRVDPDTGKLVICTSVESHAAQDGFFPPEE